MFKMEQYELAPKIAYGDIRFCLKVLEPEKIFIRNRGSHGGQVQLNENLLNRALNIQRIGQGLSIEIDGSEVFLFELDNLGKRFSLAYERVNKDNSRVCLSTGINPNDPNLPEPVYSFFRSANRHYLFELFFPGKIPLQYHSMFDKEAGWKHWKVDRKKLKEMLGEK